jgi:hypothetical protein
MSIAPVEMRRLRESNDAAGESAILGERLATDGYLFFRNVLNQAAVKDVAGAIARVLHERGLLASEDPECPTWTGLRIPEFDQQPHELHELRLWERFVQQAPINRFYESVMGEPVTWLETGVYRCVAPASERPVDVVAGRHQDGFYNEGLAIRTTWIPLVETDVAMGGLAVAEGMNAHGYLHDLAQPPQFPIPADAISAESWCRADVYRPGDAVIFAGTTPHSGLPNESDRVRISMDLRFVPASEPQPLYGAIGTVTPAAVTIVTDGGGDVTVSLTDETVIYSLGRERITRHEFASGEGLPKGTRVMVVSRDGAASVIRTPFQLRLKPQTHAAGQ